MSHHTQSDKHSKLVQEAAARPAIAFTAANEATARLVPRNHNISISIHNRDAHAACGFYSAVHAGKLWPSAATAAAVAAAVLATVSLARQAQQ